MRIDPVQQQQSAIAAQVAAAEVGLDHMAADLLAMKFSGYRRLRR
ncbi:MAG TPA: hypothetical protein PK420_00765 [Rubrivivax sp.]|nr:hypothetical protein [Rubrivivax sp.]